jgi:hypothetical protein
MARAARAEERGLAMKTPVFAAALLASSILVLGCSFTSGAQSPANRYDDAPHGARELRVSSERIGSGAAALHTADNHHDFGHRR